MRKFYSIFLRKNKSKCRQIDRENQILQKHWLDVMLGKKKSFLPLPSEVVFGMTTKQIKGLPEELNGIHKKLSILEDKIHDKSYPLDNELYQS